MHKGLSLYLLVVIFSVTAFCGSKKISSCQLCKEVTDSFAKGMAETENRNYESGSYQWVKNNLRKYEESEMRFMAIYEGLCSNSTDKSKCLTFIDNFEEDFQHWFSTLRKEDVALYDHVCVDSSELCCPSNHYGKNCDVCPGFIDDVMCSGHGTCIGDGTRRGNGSCSCTMGYGGTLCSECGSGYFVHTDGKCAPCHNSCDGTCVNHTMEGCLGKCKQGWTTEEDGKCTDVDECVVGTHDCKEGQRCLNVPGKFYCKNCHESCATCNGDDEDKCLTCRHGFLKDENNKCTDVDECADGKVSCKKGTFCQNTLGSYKCKKCHKGCKSGCEGPDLEGCHDCKDGYRKRDDGHGCEDINECDTKQKLCPSGKYCFNKVGSYKCKRCDEACNICFDEGPYSCYSCSDGHKFVNGVCTDESKIKKTEDAEDEEDL